jgi:hypothetical protein
MPFSFQAAFPIGTMCASKDVHHSSIPAVLADRFAGATFFRAQRSVRLYIRGSVKDALVFKSERGIISS